MRIGKRTLAKEEEGERGETETEKEQDKSYL
jgi:hypothetical protein